MSEQYHGNTPEDVADRMAEQLPGGLLAFEDEPGDAPPQEGEAAPEDKKDSPPEQETPGEAEEPEEEKEGTDKEPEAEEKSDKDKEPASEDDDPVFEVTLDDGEVAEVPLSELAQGFLASREIETLKAETTELRRDYERRVQEIPNEVSRRVQERENELARSIEQWTQANPLGEPPPAHWLDPNSGDDYNPDRYHYELAQYQERRQKMQAAATELQKIAAQRDEQQKAHEAQEREKLKAAWPDIVEDSAKQSAFLKQVSDHYGFTAHDIASFNDHRAFLVLRDAVGYREMKSKAPEVRQKVKAKPRPVKPGARKTEKDIKRGNVEELHKRLKKSGRPEDAENLLMERLTL